MKLIFEYKSERSPSTINVIKFVKVNIKSVGEKLRVFENKVLRRIFGPRRDEVTGDWRKLHNEELNDL